MLFRAICASAIVLLAMAAGQSASAGDAAKGKRVFNKCKACHTLDDKGKHRVGPNLFGVYGKAVGSAKGYKYSASYVEAGKKGVKWDEENLEKYLADPRKFMQEATGKKSARSKMVFKLPRKSEREDVIEYLKSAK